MCKLECQKDILPVRAKKAQISKKTSNYDVVCNKIKQNLIKVISPYYTRQFGTMDVSRHPIVRKCQKLEKDVFTRSKMAFLYI